MNQEEVDREWLTPTEAARSLRVSMGTIYSLLNADRMPSAIRVGRQWRLSRTALQTALSVWHEDITPSAAPTARERRDEQRLRARRLLSGEANRS
jgi:excisionase family DNA binding protein